MSHGGPRQRQASGTNQWMETLCKGHFWVRALIPHRAFKEETIAINRIWDNHTYRLPHDTHAISHCNRPSVFSPGKEWAGSFFPHPVSFPPLIISKIIMELLFLCINLRSNKLAKGLKSTHTYCCLVAIFRAFDHSLLL